MLISQDQNGLVEGLLLASPLLGQNPHGQGFDDRSSNAHIV